MGRPRGIAWLSLVAALSACVGWLAWSSLTAICFRHPPAALSASERPSRPPTVAPKRHPRRVVVVVLDGLRLDTSRGMPFLNRLRDDGVRAVARSPNPSLSRAAYATMATGAQPDRTGVRNNSFAAEVELDTMFDRARAAGLSTAGSGNLSWWHQNYARGLDRWFSSVRQPLDGVEAEARRALATGASLVLIHWVDLDKVAHHQGAGEEYRARSLEVDAALSRALAELDLGRDTLIVTSDHGHRDRGGHGGPEPEVVRVPLVLAGFGVRRGIDLGDVGSLGCVGPTVGVLLGTELPRDASVAPMRAGLEPAALGGDYLSARMEDSRVQRDAYERKLRARLHADSALAALIPARGEIPGSPFGRGLALALLAVGATSWVRARRRGAALAPLALLGVLALGPVLAMRFFDLPWSMSAIVEVPLLVKVLAGGTVLGLAGYLGTLSFVARRTAAPGATWRFQLGVASVVCLSAAPLMWLAFGYRHPEALPSPFVLFAPLPLAFIGGTAAPILAAARLLEPGVSG